MVLKVMAYARMNDGDVYVLGTMDGIGSSWETYVSYEPKKNLGREGALF